MVKAAPEKVIIEIDHTDWVKDGTFIVPTLEKVRKFMKEQNLRTIDENFTNHIRHGVVTSVGNKCRRDDKGIKEGDLVFFNRHNGDEFNHEMKKYIAMPWNMILCLYRGDKNDILNDEIS